MDLLNELDKLISRDNGSSTGNDVIPLDVLFRQPDGNNVTSIEVGGQFVRSIPEVVAILVAYSTVIILSLFGNSLVSMRLNIFSLHDICTLCHKVTDLDVPRPKQLICLLQCFAIEQETRKYYALKPKAKICDP